ncbi:MAG: acyltransferase [Acidobacteria bacterium]|nr:acyltransferase [Acidobacteriota bacterium]
MTVPSAGSALTERPGVDHDPAPAGTRPRRHVPELDGVRGLAIAMVMALHFINNQVIPTNVLERVAIKLTNYGLWGVDLFFVLSGFLITGILADAKGKPRYFTNFFARRSLRIFPLYYGVLLTMTVLVPAAALRAIDPQLLEVRALWPWLWTYLTNVYLASETSFSIPYVSHFWTLAIEEHFYLVWPFIIWSLATRPAMRACLVLGLGALALRVYYSVTAPEHLYAGVLTPCRIDALCAGAWFALAARDGDGQVRRRTLQVAGLAGLTIVVVSVWHFAFHQAAALLLPLRSSALAVFFGALIYSAAHHDGLHALKAALRFGWLRHLGRYSYGLYVFHGMVAYGMHRYGVPALFDDLTRVHTVNSLLMVTCGVGVSYAIAIGSYHGFEQPFLSLKSRFSNRPGPSSGA